MLQLLRHYTIIVSILFLSTAASAHGPLHEKIERVTNKIEKQPLNAALYVERGEYYKLDHNFDNAFADYQTARNLNPNLETLDFLTAELFYDFEFYNSALSSVNAFQKLNVNTAECYLLKAKILDKLFKSDSALFYAEASYPLQAKPSLQFFIQTKQYALYANPKDYDRAKYWLLEGKKRLKSSLVIQEELVDLALQFEDIASAENYCNEILPTLRRKEYWYFKLALVNHAKGDIAETESLIIKSRKSIDRLPRQHRNTSYIRNLNKRLDSLQSELKTTLNEG